MLKTFKKYFTKDYPPYSIMQDKRLQLTHFHLFFKKSGSLKVYSFSILSMGLNPKEVNIIILQSDPLCVHSVIYLFSNILVGSNKICK